MGNSGELRPEKKTKDKRYKTQEDPLLGDRNEVEIPR